MALSFNVVQKWTPPGRENGVCGWVDITLDDSFPDGGWPVAGSDLGIVKIIGFMVPAVSAGGVVLGWDPTNSKILGFEADYDATADDPLVAYATANDDCDGDIIRCYFEGV